MTIRIEAAEIDYDLLQATGLQLECKIAELNATLSSGWGKKLLRDFILESAFDRPPAGTLRTRARSISERGPL